MGPTQHRPSGQWVLKGISVAISHGVTERLGRLFWKFVDILFWDRGRVVQNEMMLGGDRKLIFEEIASAIGPKFLWFQDKSQDCSAEIR